MLRACADIQVSGEVSQGVHRSNTGGRRQEIQGQNGKILNIYYEKS
jgi:hypothetical protein